MFYVGFLKSSLRWQFLSAWFIKRGSQEKPIGKWGQQDREGGDARQGIHLLPSPGSAGFCRGVLQYTFHLSVCPCSRPGCWAIVLPAITVSGLLHSVYLPGTWSSLGAVDRVAPGLIIRSKTKTKWIKHKPTTSVWKGTQQWFRGVLVTWVEHQQCLLRLANLFCKCLCFFRVSGFPSVKWDSYLLRGRIKWYIAITQMLMPSSERAFYFMCYVYILYSTILY